MTRNPKIILALLMVLPTVAVAATEEEPPAKPELPVGWYAEIDTTLGTIVARLLPEQAPQAVAHFTALAEGRLAWNDPFTGEVRNDPYYNGVPIHKVVAGQRFEVGDPTGTGRGAAPFYLPPEGFGPVNFSWGWRLGMTTASLGRISGSLFFVTESSQPWLSGRHPCFGVVLDGKDVIRHITSLAADSSGRPRTRVLLEEIRIFKSGDPEPLPEPEHFQPKQLDFRLRDGVTEER